MEHGPGQLLPLHGASPALLISRHPALQYCEGEEPGGEEDYDDYSKDLSQYRRSKEGRGRGKCRRKKREGQPTSAGLCGLGAELVASVLTGRGESC